VKRQIDDRHSVFVHATNIYPDGSLTSRGVRKDTTCSPTCRERAKYLRRKGQL
jgi:hypothetical protein